MTGRSAASALDPVRLRIRQDAEAVAARLRAAAMAEATAIIARARQEADAAVARAAAKAEQAAAALMTAELRQARDAARVTILAAQQAACDELRRQVRASVAALPREPDYDRLLHQIGMLAARAAGPGATLTPARGGGVIASGPGVMVDCSLGRLADLAVAGLGAEINQLWMAP